MEGEEKRGPGRPKKNPKAPKYPMNPTPNMQRIRTLVMDAIKYANAPIEGGDFLGAAYSNRFGYCKHALESIAEELGVN